MSATTSLPRHATGGRSAGRLAEISVLVTANLVATVLRFLLFRHWVFGKRRGLGQQRDFSEDRDSGERQITGPYPAIGTVEMATQGERNL